MCKPNLRDNTSRPQPGRTGRGGKAPGWWGGTKVSTFTCFHTPIHLATDFMQRFFFFLIINLYYYRHRLWYLRVLVWTLDAVEDDPSFRVIAVHLGILKTQSRFQKRFGGDLKHANADAHRDFVLLPGFAHFNSQVSHHDHAGEARQNHVSILFGKNNHLDRPVGANITRSISCSSITNQKRRFSFNTFENIHFSLKNKEDNCGKTWFNCSETNNQSINK